MDKLYYIITIGCQMNKSDSERIAKYLESLGYILASNDSCADVVVITTCGIRQSAEDRVYGLIPRIKKDNPKSCIILTGCLSEREDVKKRVEEQVDIWLPIKDLGSLKYKLAGKDLHGDYADCYYLKFEAKYESDFSAFVPIGNGCNNFCSYCVVPYARGREVYRDHNEVIKEVKDLLNRGYKEITLIAQNVNSYISSDKKTDFADLLKMVNDLDGDFWLRFSTSHPKDMSDKLINTMVDCNKLCHHLHLPAQAGNNYILRAMNRKYSIEDYLALIKKVKNKISDMSFTTDIIVGFPGETGEQFKDTKKLFEKVGYDMAYIAQYSPRPGKMAEKLKDDVSKEEKKKREEELMAILRKT
ncbi:tRNA (N6-isopentenyl adenosine(37)-C2)-methylthiotransferase MiaB [Candidatus Parcubacteria bacterium]|nr:MAG: tRNA (N6-isopentenyl adenosine(37)-C2)-methylthiotransferase MiaB [Candidatus Parcubacteria bacterium]